MAFGVWDSFDSGIVDSVKQLDGTKNKNRDVACQQGDGIGERARHSFEDSTDASPKNAMEIAMVLVCHPRNERVRGFVPELNSTEFRDLATFATTASASSVGNVADAASIGPARFTDEQVLSERALSGARGWRSVPFGNHRVVGLRILIACL